LNIDKITEESYIRDVLNHSRLSTQQYYTNKLKGDQHGKT